MNYTLKQIADIVGGELIGCDQLTVHRVITDSRGLGNSPDELFIALRGENHDGHRYIDELVGRGVRAFLVNNSHSTSIPEGCGAVTVDDTFEAMRRLTLYHRDRFRGVVVAVTGSNGKTITKEWIVQLCPERLKLFRSPRSYNSQVGVPLSLLMLQGDEDVAVIEAGISQVGEMERLERLIKPDIGIITNIGDAHSENFRSQQHKLQEKLLLFKNCRTIVCSRNDKRIMETVLEQFPDRTIYLIDEQNLTISSPNQPDGVRIDFQNLLFTDDASRQNALFAVALLIALGVDIEEITIRLPLLQPVAMRLEMKEGINGCKIINDTYNSDINSLRLALNYMSSIAKNTTRTLILSDIYQSGLSESDLYQQVADMIHASGINRLIGIGSKIFQHSHRFDCQKEFFITTASMLGTLDRNAFRDTTILIKGSRDFQFEKISRALEQKIHTTVLEVDLDAMSHNLNYLRNKLPFGTKVMAMVKALSYGAGSYEVAAMLENQRIDYLAVAFADEGITLREAGIKLPIVVLNADSWSFAQMIDYRLEPEIYSLQSMKMFVNELRRSGDKNYPIHLKLDTGMHRLGLQENEIKEVVDFLKTSDYVRLSSIFSHLAASDETCHDDFTRQQIVLFDRLSRQIQSHFPDRKITRHLANSAAIERFPEACFDMVRLGIGLYGISSIGDSNLHNISVLKSRIVQIKQISDGETVGYGRHGDARGGRTVATLPMGYADGLNRHLGNGRWSMLVGGKLAPIIGNICMDTCMLDVTGLAVNEGDEVEIFGSHNTVSQMAERLNTIPYEIMTTISTRVKRIYIKE